MSINGRLIAAALVVFLAIPLFAGCGDDDGGKPGEIRTESGLGVALVAANADLARAGAAGNTQDDGGAAPQAPETGNTAADAAGETALMQQLTDGITVSGYGTATVAADIAVVEFYFGSYGTAVRPDEPAQPGSSEGGGSDDIAPEITAASITEEDLQPVIDALLDAGVAREDIEFLGSSYYYDAYWYSATLRVTVRDLGNLGDAVGAATDASLELSGISLQGTYVSYAVEDCAPLEAAALSAAVDDASARADAFATALGVTKGALTGAQTYSYSPFGGSPCSVGDIGPYPVAGVAYSEARATDVTLYANVTLTYAIQ